MTGHRRSPRARRRRREALIRWTESVADRALRVRRAREVSALLERQLAELSIPGVIIGPMEYRSRW